MTMNVMGNQGDIHMQANAEEEEEDKAHNANDSQIYFSLDGVKNQFLEALPPIPR